MSFLSSFSLPFPSRHFFYPTASTSNGGQRLLRPGLLLIVALFVGGLSPSVHAQTRVIDIYDGTYYSSPAYSSPSFFRSAGGTVFFEVDDRFGGGDTYGEVLWTTDGTEAGTSLLKDTKPGSNQGGFRSAGDWTASNGTLYFPADDGSNGIELWKSDGTTTGTQMIKDINPSGDGVLTDEFAVYNGEVYFTASDGTDGFELWKTNGTTSGTVMVKDLDPSGGGRPHSFVVFSNELFFTTASDCNLWKTDGTESGTVRVADQVCPTPTKLTAVGSTLFFSGFTNGQDRDLWAYNGSTAQIVKNIAPGEITDPRHLTAFNGTLYFTIETSTSGRELWTSDGTEAGTQLLTDINSGSDSALDTQYGSEPDFTIVDDQLFFVADDGTNGDELWVTDGTSAGTHLVKDLTSSPSGVGPTPPYDLTAMNGRVYFGISTATYGEEVWSSDGTAANTVLLNDLKDGSASSRPDALYAHEGTLYFSAEDNTHGQELWISNGVPSVTSIVTSDATVDFEETGVDLAFSGVGTAGEVTVEKLATSPSGTDGIPSGEIVSSYRFVIEADETLTFTSADVRLDVSTLGGVSNPGSVTLYKRSTPGTGSFTKLTTNYESSPNELRATVSSFSEFVLVSDTDPLPVELANFDARLSGEDAVTLQWKTTSETNNAGFAIQRRISGNANEAGTALSEAGENWQTVEKMDGAGTTTESQTYRFTDGDLPYAANRLTYRLKQVDTDGTTSVSDAVTVERGPVQALQLRGTYPNPARSAATVRYAIPETIASEDARLRLYDVMGRQVRTLPLAQDGGRHQHRLDVSTLASGTYVLRLTASGTTKTQRLTVVR